MGNSNALRVALSQLNPTVGALEENADRVIAEIKKAAAQKAELIVFPELVISGYGCGDLVLRKQFLREERRQLKRIARATRRFKNLYVLLGCFDEFKVKNGSSEESGHCGRWKPGKDVANKEVYNAAALIRAGKIEGFTHKIHLPTYDVFDELRWFREGNTNRLVVLEFPKKTVRLGVSVCADIWWNDIIASQAKQGADILINLSASPFHQRKMAIRERMLASLARKHDSPIVYANLVGGHDGIVFYGRSYVVSQVGKILAEAKSFEEDFFTVDIPLASNGRRGRKPYSRITEKRRISEIRKALVLGLRDYVEKNNFPGVILGLSGGIDSALVAALAVEALGKDKVTAVFMPSRFTSELSRRIVHDIAGNLGFYLHEISIDEFYQDFLDTLAESMNGVEKSVAAENIQARLRGMLLMAHSNKNGELVLVCGNKSELATGYCTLYGDMAGGFSVLSDIYKTDVYVLARHLNAEWRKKRKKEPIPRAAITREPTAELRENQTDQDVLPPYDVLDAILKLHLWKRKGAKEIIRQGFDAKTVRSVLHMVKCAEFKRKQMPLGIRVSSSNLGQGRIYPVTNNYSC